MRWTEVRLGVGGLGVGSLGVGGLGIAAIGAALIAACGMLPASNMRADADGADGSPAMIFEGILIGPQGMTLYTSDKDIAKSGKSVCVAACAANWPPFAAPARTSGGGEWTVIARDDGTRQWAYKGKPLYYWSKDQKPGDRRGDGVNGAWHVAHP